MNKRFQALGRLKQGQMNRTEAEYGTMLEALKRSGEILWYKFECINLRLADNTFYKPDFLVLSKDSVLEVHEVKARFVTEDGWQKLKITAELFPFKFVLAQKKNKQWEINEL